MQNRNSRKTSLGRACWVLTDVAQFYAKGVAGYIDNELVVVPANPTAAVDALTKVLGQRGQDIRAELETIDPRAVPFLTYAADQLDEALKVLEGADAKLGDLQKLQLLDKVLNLDEYPGVKDFVALTKADPACQL